MKKQRIVAVMVVVSTTLAALTGLGATTADAASVCTGDLCVVVPDTVQTPLGLATITVSATDVVTVQLAPTTANTLVVGIPFGFPPGPLTFVRTSIDTSGGQVNIDTYLIPPGPPTRLALPNLAIVSIHPPGPCRVRTNGTMVVFTPIIGD